jgi:hypothetical protein
MSGHAICVMQPIMHAVVSACVKLRPLALYRRGLRVFTPSDDELINSTRSKELVTIGCMQFAKLLAGTKVSRCRLHLHVLYFMRCGIVLFCNTLSAGACTSVRNGEYVRSQLAEVCPEVTNVS